MLLASLRLRRKETVSSVSNASSVNHNSEQKAQFAACPPFTAYRIPLEAESPFCTSRFFFLLQAQRLLRNSIRDIDCPLYAQVTRGTIGEQTEPGSHATLVRECA